MSRTSRRDLRELLEVAGSVEVPRRAESVQLLDPPRSASPAVEIDELATRRERRRGFPVLLTGAAGAVVVMLILASLTGVLGSGADRGSGGGSELAFRTAVDTVVVLPDGRTVQGARGLELPDGTIIRTGPDGRATIAGVRLGPDTLAVVEDGRLRVLADVAPEDPAGNRTGSAPAEPEPSGGTGTGASSSEGDDPPSSSPPAVPLPPVVVPPLPTFPSIEDLGPIR